MTDVQSTSLKDAQLNPLIATLEPHSNRPSYSNTVIGTLAIDGWAVTFGTVRRELGGATALSGPPRCTKCMSPVINGQCTNFVLLDIALCEKEAIYNCLWSLKG